MGPSGFFFGQDYIHTHRILTFGIQYKFLRLTLLSQILIDCLYDISQSIVLNADLLNLGDNEKATFYIDKSGIYTYLELMMMYLKEI